MQEFFSGWKRRIGVVTLAIACVLVGALIRCHSTTDLLSFRTGIRSNCLIASHQSRLMLVLTPDSEVYDAPYSWASSFPTMFNFPWVTNKLNLSRQGDWSFQDYGLGFEFIRSPKSAKYKRLIWLIPYWPFAVALTFLSAYLLLSKPSPLAEMG